MDIRDVKDWNYRAEGNLHIIIANEKSRQVLRLLKCFKDKKIYSEFCASKATENELCFIRHVAHPLMENCKACFPIQKVAVTREFLKMISKKIEPDRPKIRLNKVIDQSCKFGILMPDFCQILPPSLSVKELTISVEIKPKQGFILVGNDQCKYSHFQLLKLQNNTYDRISAYCPVDLFSGSKKRMQKAIKALISDPQNNFRVFRGGDVIYSQEIVQQSKLKAKELFSRNVLTVMSCLTQNDGPANLDESFQDFQDVLCNLLLHPVSKLQHSRHAAQFCERHASIDSHRKLTSLCNGFGEKECGLPADCILGLLLSLQKLESYTIEEYYEMYVLLQDHLRVFPGERDSLSLEAPFDAQCWKDLVEEIKCRSNYDMRSNDMWKLDVRKAASLLRKFLIAASFKDCSIIMTFRARLVRGCVDSEESTGPVVIKTRSKHEYFASLAIVDSDPKPASRIPEYYRSTFASD